MDKLRDIVNGKYGKSLTKLEQDYQKNYDDDTTFRVLANKTKLSNETLMKYTTKLEIAASELKH